jgi:predicted amidohydrolase
MKLRLLFFASCWVFPPAATPLDVALVQYQVRPQDYHDLSRFEERVDAFVDSAVEGGADLVVFPEYINVFALFHHLISEHGRIDLSAVPNGVSSALSGGGAETAVAAAEVRSFLWDYSVAETAVIRTLWSRVARRHEVWILAGSSFVARSGGELTNQGWLFDPQGRLAYRQNKVFLTPFERNVLGLSPGTVESAQVVSVAGYEIGLTICRDSYFEDWEQPFAAVDLWVDIRANGEPWTPEVRRRFDTALPERVEQTAVEHGVSTSLTGEFAGLLWQGPAFVVNDEGRRVREAPTHRGDHLLLVDIP